MDISDARTFIAVVEAGSISRAACELHLTQPAVTRRLQRLESVIGAQLIDRRTRPFGLTDIGQAAVERCRRLVSTRDELKSLAQGGTVPTRECRIGVAHALTTLALVEPIDEMRAAFPLIVPRLVTGWSRDLVERVRSGALDAAALLLPVGESSPSGIDAEPLANEELLIIAPGSARHRTWSAREVAEVGWILNPEGCAARGWLQKLLARAGLPLRVCVETYNYELQMSLVARGRGLGLVPSRLLAASPLRRQLCTPRIRGLAFPMNIWLMTAILAPALDLPIKALARSLATRLARKGVRK